MTDRESNFEGRQAEPFNQYISSEVLPYSPLENSPGSTMEDSATLFIRMKRLGGLRVDTAPLESLLQDILEKIRYHEQLTSKLPYLEESQAQLKKEVNELKLNTSSKESLDKLGFICSNNTEENRDSNHSDGDYLPKIQLPPIPSAKNMCNNTIDSLSDVLKTERPSSSSSFKSVSTFNGSCRDTQKELRGIKAIIQQIQKEHDHSLASSMQTDERVNVLKIELLSLQRGLASSATLDDTNQLQKMMNRQQQDLQRYVSDFSKVFRLDTNESTSRNLLEVKAWFKDLEDMIRQRQTKLDARMVSLARESDLQALQSNFNSESIEVREQIEFVSDSLCKTSKTLKTYKERNAISTFNMSYIKWKHRVLQSGWKRWTIWLRDENEARQKNNQKSKLMKNVLIRFSGGNKKKGFFRWVRFLKWHRKFEVRKEIALKVLGKWMKRSVREPTEHAFRQWRRTVTIDRINERYINGNYSPEKNDSDNNLGSKQDFSLPYALASLQNDEKGISQLLMQEIENIRTFGIGRLRKDWDDTRVNISKKVDEKISDGTAELQARVGEHEKLVNEKIREFSNELPSIKGELFQLRNTLTGTQNRVKNIEESHSERIELLFEHKEAVDERLHQIEARLHETDDKVKALEHEQCNAKELVVAIFDQMKENEVCRNDERKRLGESISYIHQQLQELKGGLLRNESRCADLDSSLDRTTYDLDQHQGVTRNEFELVHKVLNTPGLRKPSLNKMVQHCIVYEKLANEKKYVVSISSITTGAEGINLPAHIAAFAHDYAAWIAYQADHEALMRVVAGVNPEELVYAEEETAPRRKTLLDW